MVGGRNVSFGHPMKRKDSPLFISLLHSELSTKFILLDAFLGRQIPNFPALPHLKEATFHAKILYFEASATPHTPSRRLQNIWKLFRALHSLPPPPTSRSNHLIFILIVVQPRASTCLSEYKKGGRTESAIFRFPLYFYSSFQDIPPHSRNPTQMENGIDSLLFSFAFSLSP